MLTPVGPEWFDSRTETLDLETLDLKKTLDLEFAQNGVLPQQEPWTSKKPWTSNVARMEFRGPKYN